MLFAYSRKLKSLIIFSSTVIPIFFREGFIFLKFSENNARDKQKRETEPKCDRVCKQSQLLIHRKRSPFPHKGRLKDEVSDPARHPERSEAESNCEAATSVSAVGISREYRDESRPRSFAAVFFSRCHSRAIHAEILHFADIPRCHPRAKRRISRDIGIVRG